MEIFLDNVRSIFNVGAIFRTADGAGVEKIYLAGFTPYPPNVKLNKTSIGALDYVKWEHIDQDNILEFLKYQKQIGKRIVSIEQSSKSLVYTNSKEIVQWDNTIYIFGNEIKGVDDNILDLSDRILEIPMYGKKNSLNISVTVGIIVYEARRNTRKT